MLRISENWAAMPPSLTCLLTTEQQKAHLTLYLDGDRVVLAEIERKSSGNIWEHVVAVWRVEEFSVREARAAAERWMGQKAERVA